MCDIMDLCLRNINSGDSVKYIPEKPKMGHTEANSETCHSVSLYFWSIDYMHAWQIL